MNTVKILKLSIIVPLLALSIYGIVRLFVDMINNETDLFIGFIVMFMLVIMAGMMLWALVPLLKGDRLLKHGKQAVATVLEVWDTGITVDELDYLVGLLLEVRPPGQPSYQVKTKTRVSRVQPDLYQPGMVVQVRYDPRKPKKVSIEGIGSQVGNQAVINLTGMMNTGTVSYQGQTYTKVDDLPPEARAKYEQAMSAMADKDGNGIPDILQGAMGNISAARSGRSTGASGTDPAEKLRKLEQLLAEGLITRQEYEAKKAEILSRM